MASQREEVENSVPNPEKSSQHSTSSENRTSATAGDHPKPFHVEPEKVDDESTTGPTTPDFPEGGWKAWTVVAGTFCVQFCGFGYSTCFGVYQDYYTRTFITSESPSTISWIGSVNTLIVVSSGLLTGRMFDKGYFYHLIYGGSALIVLSLFTLSLAHPDHIYQNFLAQAVGHGLGAGLMYIPSLAILSHYFRRRRTLVMGITSAGSSLGAIVHPIMLNNLFVKVGFRKAVQASAGMITGFLVIACLLLHPRLPPSAELPDIWKSVKKCSKDGPYMLVALGYILFPVGMYFPLFYVQLDAIKHGLSENFSFYSLVILNIASLFGRLSVGVLVKYIPVAWMMALWAGICSIMIFALVGVTTVAGFVIFGIIYGLGAGAYIALMGPLVIALSEDITELGTRMGLAFTIAGFAMLIGPPVQGALLTKNFVWWRPAVFSGVFGVLGTAAFVVTGYLLDRRQKKARVDRSASDVLGSDMPRAE